mmetsp:Transcript_43839/g.121276  ORF Transcript_43839/g.121276 Transcript_43839/m.121276 type:complete len:235 (+) Transcript_43839:549-1253(+)
MQVGIEVGVGHAPLGFRREAETAGLSDLLVPEPVVQAAECTRKDEEDVARTESRARRLRLRRARRERDLHVLHELQECVLHAPAEAAMTAARLLGADLVDLVYVHDAKLGDVDITAGGGHEVLQHVVRVAPDVAGLCEFRRVGLDEWHADQPREGFQQICLPAARRPKQQDVRLRVVRGIRRRFVAGAFLQVGVARAAALAAALVRLVDTAVCNPRPWLERLLGLIDLPNQLIA